MVSLSTIASDQQNKAFLHCLKLKFPYQPQITEIAAKFNNDWQRAFQTLLKDIDVNAETEKLEKLSIQTLYIEQPEYPRDLRKIKNPPSLLYYRGALPKDYLNLAVVGSRKASSYGVQVTEHLITALSGQQINIISGLAYGIDSCAHITALNSDLPTIAVLGSGLDDACIYPRQNLNLAHQIIQSGGVLFSEFPPGTKAEAKHFPFRNRIVAGLSRGVIIVEASTDSGALITARIARAEHRDVFAVPGDIFESLCAGPNELLKEAAKALTSAHDLREFYNLEIPVELPAQQQLNLSELEQNVLAAIKKSGSTNEQIRVAAGIGISEISFALTTLEIKNIIKVDRNNLYRLNLTRSNNAG